VRRKILALWQAGWKTDTIALSAARQAITCGESSIIGTALAIPIAVMVITVIPGVVVVVVIIGAMMVVAAVIIAVPPATCLGLV
jgi:hypothetical protein